MLTSVIVNYVFTCTIYDQYGRTALGAAAYGGHTETVKLLLDKGANVDATDKVNEMMSGYHVMFIIS